jgi:F0F1-type ATP synthase membrane subunit b/b'
MLNSETIISIFFKILNFGVLIGLGVYIFKRYFVQNINDQIDAKQNMIAQLQGNNQALKQEEHDIAHAAEQQHQLSEQLVQKIALWRAAHTHEMARKKAEYEEIYKNRIKKIAKQEEIYALDVVQKKVVPSAIEQAREMLQQHSMSLDVQQRYTTDILDYIERGAQ